ncbi:hypothetical protein PHYBOEH_003435 [Phytophthora boehmeriae]|uniref:FATC domain-containing protein n=1 Tax=Phytophthora boehmeriae TaxID=109152 RepID=A0A8T1WTH9_9STRA|nr:hypothetical protein PHYBOEH_003435 [Phytophthora boehmeriae]
MADRFSTSEDENHGVGSGTAPLEDETEEEEEQGDTDDVITVAEGNSDVLGTDSGNGSNDSNASPSLDRTEPKSQYGLQVLKRIEDKLLGIVTEMTPVMTVEQQAAWLIDEATNVDNLCVMYEGWTPWI